MFYYIGSVEVRLAALANAPMGAERRQMVGQDILIKNRMTPEKPREFIGINDTTRIYNHSAVQ